MKERHEPSSAPDTTFRCCQSNANQSSASLGAPFPIQPEARAIRRGLPLRDLAHMVGPTNADLAGEHRTEPVDPAPHALVADIDAALVQKVFDIP